MNNGQKRIRVLSWDAEHLREIAPGTVYMRHSYGEDVGVALFRIISKDNRAAPIPRHSHGEEVNYVIKGSGSLNGCRFKAGDILLIPSGLEHGAETPVLEGDRDVILLSVITPPRRTYGPEDESDNPWAKGP